MRFSLFATLASLALTQATVYKGIYDAWSFDLVDAENADWMATLRDDVHLQDLSIPGTHNSMTDRLKSSLMQTQSEPLADQLTGGIRYIDISCRYIKHDMRVYHGLTDTGYSLQDVLTTLFDFLDNHSREVILLRIQKGGIFDDTRTFLSSMEAHLVSGSELSNRAVQYIYSTDAHQTLPTLGQARGKVIILQDFKTNPAGGYGIFWNSNTISSYSHRLAPGTLFSSLKWEGIKSNINRSRCRDYQKLRITYTTASAGVKPITISSGKPARINQRLGQYIKYNRGNCFGIVVMDFPGFFLVNYMVDINKKYQVPRLSNLREQVYPVPERSDLREAVNEPEEFQDEDPIAKPGCDEFSDDENDFCLAI
ncbi:1-phosphatidylinositol phosphodiesterase [Ceratocystis lukuohia]|uniref:1-phosphatidylinositol phosphodiesterase n=1 Tax=Ceratocystis lukuohia TaxID=2019550 RepID=A0ABR4MA80_9PEZI